MGQFVINHWRGKHPAVFTLIGTLIGGRVLIRLLYGVAPGTMPFIAVYLIIAVDVAVLIWQVVGTLRSCERTLKHGGDMILYWICYGAAIVASIVVIYEATSLISTTSGATPVPIPPVVSLTVQDDTVLIEGFIGFRTHTALLALLENTENQIRTARLHSDGGRVFAARAIANALIANDIDTEVTGRCASACTLIFMAGNERRLLDGGQLGFHQYAQTSSVRILDTSAEQEKDRAYFKSRGVAESFIAQMFQARHQDIWFPELPLLRDAGIVTD